MKQLLVALTLVLLSTSAGAQWATVDFDNPSVGLTRGQSLNGIYQGVDFGTEQWGWWDSGEPVTSTAFIYFVYPWLTSQSFTFVPGPRRLLSIRAFVHPGGGIAGELTLSDDLGQTTDSVTIAPGEAVNLVTGWTQMSTTVTVTFTAGWHVCIDDIVYELGTPVLPALNGTVGWDTVLTVEYTEPDTNDDGSALMDLAFIRLYCTVNSEPEFVCGEYPASSPAGGVRMSQTLSATVTGSVQVRATAVNAAGRESWYSNTATKSQP